ncbi:MAG: exopolysaccharide biosynthesis protein [Micropepsaceae bacterium]
MSDLNHRSTSEILLALVRAHPEERMSIQDIIDGLGERSFGFVLLLFGIASAVAPPGVATFTAIPLMFFGLQMLARYRTPWLPRSIAMRSFVKADLEKTILRGVPTMRWIERFCRPRLLFLIGPLGERLLGLLIFILAVVIALPGPLTNAPPGFAIAFMSIAIIERDGLLVFAGVVASMFALYLGFLGLHLVIEHVLPGVWEFLVSTWQLIAG